MADARPCLFSIPVHRAFADALADGLIKRFAGDDLGLARGVILLPSNRARMAVQAAFVRAGGHGGGQGLLMPRLAVVGDSDLDESVGLALDGLDSGEVLPPAIDALQRRLMLAELIEQNNPEGEDRIEGAAAFILAEGLARVLDQLHYEEIDHARLADIEANLGELANHWQLSWHRLRLLVEKWPAALARTGLMDRADRRNQLLNRVAANWAVNPPARFVVAAGVTTAAPAITRLLRTIADMDGGMVVIPGVDMAMSDEEWDALGPAPVPADHIGLRPLETHPQYHLKLLLGRMGATRDDVQPWDGVSEFDGPAERDPFLSLMFAPAAFTHRWQHEQNLAPALANVQAASFADDAQEAQAIALLMRHALETPARTAALVTPDRNLARRVASALARWGIGVDDSAGQPLSQTPPGAVLALLAQLGAEFDPVTLIGLLSHPLVRKGERRLIWLDHVRGLDLFLRGPGLLPGWQGISARIAERADDPKARGHALAVQLRPWWDEIMAQLHPLLNIFHAGHPAPPAAFLDGLQQALEWLTGEDAWRGPAGRALAAMFDRWTLAREFGPALVRCDDFPQMLAELMAGESVRSPFGGHPRLFIWGLLEARLQRADVMILGGLDEGRWPPRQSPDAWLAPGVRRMLGLAPLERQQGAAAHDFAGAFAARQVVITRANRSGGDPTVASRFWLRLAALGGDLPEPMPDGVSLVRLAAELDVPLGRPYPAPRPKPKPPTDVRPRKISVTGVDNLARDPYSYYAKQILGLLSLDPLSALPDPRWRGTRLHAVFENWVRAGGSPAAFEAEMAALRADPALDPLAARFWLPRVEPALRWAAAQVMNAEDRKAVGVEVRGEMQTDGITLFGTADRVDQDKDGQLTIVDYKSGGAPSASSAAAGLDNQLGLLGLLAREGHMKGVDANAIAALEYWSLAPKRDRAGEGTITNTYGSRSTLKSAEQAVDHAADILSNLAARYLLGTEAFEPGANAKYGDYDQLMRRDEWFGREDVDA